MSNHRLLHIPTAVSVILVDHNYNADFFTDLSEEMFDIACGIQYTNTKCRAYIKCEGCPWLIRCIDTNKAEYLIEEITNE